ncbi:hypothetical protein D3C84_971960 [compost metagenome]
MSVGQAAAVAQHDGFCRGKHTAGGQQAGGEGTANGDASRDQERSAADGFGQDTAHDGYLIVFVVVLTCSSELARDGRQRLRVFSG